MKRIIVTGTSNGIGRELAKQLLLEGYSVVGIDKQASTITENKERYTHIISDLGKRNETEQLCEKLAGEEYYGMVNNAAEILGAEWDRFNFDDWDTCIQANLTSPLMLVHALRNNFCEGGTIVNISSQGANKAAFNGIPYTFTKAGLLNITKSLAANLGSRKIRVNAVLPGWVNTESAKPFVPHVVEEVTPLKRIAEPIDVVNVILFLLSEKSSFINGAEITVDGGFDAIDYTVYELDN